MRAALAYAPSVALVLVGLIAVALIPPIAVPTACNCPAQSSAHPVQCVCASGYSVDLVGGFVLFATWTAAVAYALVVRRVRRRADPAATS